MLDKKISMSILGLDHSDKTVIQTTYNGKCVDNIMPCYFLFERNELRHQYLRRWTILTK